MTAVTRLHDTGTRTHLTASLSVHCPSVCDVTPGQGMHAGHTLATMHTRYDAGTLVCRSTLVSTEQMSLYCYPNGTQVIAAPTILQLLTAVSISQRISPAGLEVSISTDLTKDHHSNWLLHWSIQLAQQVTGSTHQPVIFCSACPTGRQSYSDCAACPTGQQSYIDCVHMGETALSPGSAALFGAQTRQCSLGQWLYYQESVLTQDTD